MALPEIDSIIMLYKDAQASRSPFENEWRVAASYCLPAQYEAWQTIGPRNNSNRQDASRMVAYDTTAARSLDKYKAILERIATPNGMKWHGLQASDAALRAKRRVKEYFDTLTELLFKERYDPAANFRVATSEMYSCMGVYGNGPVYIAERKLGPLVRSRGFRYVACPMRDIFVLADDEGNVTHVFRRFWLNARQHQSRWPGKPLPKGMNAGPMHESDYKEFVHCVGIRTADYDAKALDARRHPVWSSYIAVEAREYVGDERGYQSIPYKIPRTMSEAGSPYGHSPAMRVRGAMGSASAIKKTYLKQGQKAVDPPLFTSDDGVLNGEIDIRPGAINHGGVSRDGKELVKALPPGNFRVAETILQDERLDIEDSFFVTLFQILTENPEMTATEVIERVAEKAALLSPTMGRMQSEFLGPTIEREIDLLVELGRMPQMPPELIEAAGEYSIQYTSPLAKGMYAEEVAGFQRSVEMSIAVATATQDPSALDHYNFDVAIPEIADNLSVPARWMNDEAIVKARREARAEQIEQQQAIDAAPAAASIAKTMADKGSSVGKPN
jgi:hypothetical protein